MPKRRLSDYYSFRLFVSFLLSLALMFSILLILSHKSSGNIPPPGPIVEETPAVPEQTVPPTCQDFASEPKGTRVESWRRLLWDGLATSGATKEAIQCAIDSHRVRAFDDALEVGCLSGGAFSEVFMAEMNRHLVPCGFEIRRNQ
jgi:hypothetical protein